jgi:excisionase family DNA binding protein
MDLEESDSRAFRIREVCKRTGLGRTTIYLAIKDGSLKAKKCGRTTIVMASDLREWLTGLPTLQRSPASSADLNAIGNRRLNDDSKLTHAVRAGRRTGEQ